MRGESPRGLDTELYGETNEKDSWGPRSLWPTRRFRVNSLGSRVTGHVPYEDFKFPVTALITT